jgi:hypothetical protein
MNDDYDDIGPNGDELSALLEQTEKIARRIEAGDPAIADEGLEDDQPIAGPIREILPTLRTMVAIGEQIAYEEGSRKRFQTKKVKRAENQIAGSDDEDTAS